MSTQRLQRHVHVTVYDDGLVMAECVSQETFKKRIATRSCYRYVFATKRVIYHIAVQASVFLHFQVNVFKRRVAYLEETDTRVMLEQIEQAFTYLAEQEIDKQRSLRK